MRFALPLRRVMLVGAFALLALAVVSLRTALMGRAALARADAAFDRGDLEESVREARRAASLRMPGGAHVDAAYTRLLVIARGAEAVGRTDLSIAAWDATRAAALESETPWGDPRPELERANQNLARLRAHVATAERAPARTAPLERELLRSLERPARPSGAQTALVALGFVLALVGFVWGAVQGIDRHGAVRKRQLLLGLLVALVGFACWTFAVAVP